jgi:hypothetical protein
MHHSGPVTTIVTLAMSDSAMGWLSVGLAAAIATLSGRAFFRLRGTTLAAPAAWAVAAALALAAVDVVLAGSGSLERSFAASLARYAAAAATCCPLMAVLGAKRPQDRGWQWVVLTLWIVLLVPAGQAWMARAGGQLQLTAPWRILLWALISMGLLNYLLTRHAAPAVLVAIGQIGLLSEFMLDEPPDRQSVLRLVGVAALLAAAAIAGIPTRRRRDPLTRRWLAIRDGWGAFWGLRVLNRVNETATQLHWPVRLEWSGFVANDGGDSVAPIDDRLAGQIGQVMDSLLRRFERLPPPAFSK